MILVQAFKVKTAYIKTFFTQYDPEPVVSALVQGTGAAAQGVNIECA
jgi:hypothetical protein